MSVIDWMQSAESECEHEIIFILKRCRDVNGGRPRGDLKSQHRTHISRASCVNGRSPATFLIFSFLSSFQSCSMFPVLLQSFFPIYNVTNVNTFNCGFSVKKHAIRAWLWRAPRHASCILSFLCESFAVTTRCATTSTGCLGLSFAPATALYRENPYAVSHRQTEAVTPDWSLAWSLSPFANHEPREHVSDD